MTKHYYILYYSYHCKVIKQRTLPVFYLTLQMSIYLSASSMFHPTLVLLPRKSHGWKSLVGCSPWGRGGSDTTERLHFHLSLSCIGEGNGNPLQCSCLENPGDGEVWWAAIYGVAQSRTRLKWLSSSSSSSSSVFTIISLQLTFCKKIFDAPTNLDLSILGSGRSPGEKKWQPTPVFLSGKSHGQKSLVGYSLWGHKESDATEQLKNNNQESIGRLWTWGTCNWVSRILQRWCWFTACHSMYLHPWSWQAKQN